MERGRQYKSSTVSSIPTESSHMTATTNMDHAMTMAARRILNALTSNRPLDVASSYTGGNTYDACCDSNPATWTSPSEKDCGRHTQTWVVSEDG
eukprot:200836-Chlamydomonas_euryale.AAC.2